MSLTSTLPSTTPYVRMYSQSLLSATACAGVWGFVPFWILRFASSRRRVMWSTDEMSGLFICFFSNFSNSRRMPSISSFTLTQPLLLIPLARNQTPVGRQGLCGARAQVCTLTLNFCFNLDRVISHFLKFSQINLPAHLASGPDTSTPHSSRGS